MSEPTSQPSEAQTDTHATSSGKKSWAAVLALVALIVALAAVGLGIWSVQRQPGSTTASAPPKPSADQIAAAKTHACSAFKTVTTAVSLQTHANPGPDVPMQQAVAANSRLAMFGGGAYLTTSLDPATPQDISTDMRTFATQLQTVAMNALAGKGNDDPDQSELLKAAQASTDRIQKLCA